MKAEVLDDAILVIADDSVLEVEEERMVEVCGEERRPVWAIADLSWKFLTFLCRLVGWAVVMGAFTRLVFVGR